MTAAKQLSPWTFVPTCPFPAIPPHPRPSVQGLQACHQRNCPFSFFV